MTSHVGFCRNRDVTLCTDCVLTLCTDFVYCHNTRFTIITIYIYGFWFLESLLFVIQFLGKGCWTTSVRLEPILWYCVWEHYVHRYAQDSLSKHFLWCHQCSRLAVMSLERETRRLINSELPLLGVDKCKRNHKKTHHNYYQSEYVQNVDPANKERQHL